MVFSRTFVFLLSLVFFTLTQAEEALLIEPEAGRAPILSAIHHAKSSIDLVMYGLTDRAFIQALTRAKHLGKNITVLLESHPYRIDNENRVAFQRFNTANISLGSSSRFKFIHQKTLLTDNKTAFIMTFNFTHSAFKHQRNFALVIDDPAMIQEIENVLRGDLAHQKIAVNHPDLLWSPENAREKLLLFIQKAKSDIHIYAETLSDYQIISELARASRKGIRVEILLSKESAHHHQKKLNYLRRAGVVIRFNAHYLIHAKVIIIDHTQALLGSINLTSSSIDHNRELSVITKNQHLVSLLEKTFSADWME